MKPIKSLILFCILGVLIFGPFVNYLVPESSYGDLPNWQVIVNSKKNQTTLSQVVVGDSVGHQVFAVDEKNYKLLTTQSISMLGQYILLKNALESNPNTIRKAVLSYIPHSFSNDLDQPYTFRDVVKSLLWVSNFSDLSIVAMQKIFRFPQSVLGFFSVFKINNSVQMDYGYFFPYSHSYKEPFTQYKPLMSDISIDYLKRMKELCLKHNVAFLIIPSPISEGASLDFAEMKERIHAEGLDDLFVNYFEKLLILPKSYFKDDIHLHSEHFKMAYNHILPIIEK